MKQFFAIGFLPILFALGVTINGNDAPTTSSKVEWKGYKVTGSHYGTIDVQSADVEFDADGKLSGGEVVIDMNTLKTLDLTGEYAGKLEGHLKSDDFFGVATYPTASLKITNVAEKGTPGDYKVVADLTIKGTTKPVKFYANVAEKDGAKVVTTSLKVDRSEYDVRYGSGSFFSNLGDKTIYDEFDLDVTLTVK